MFANDGSFLELMLRRQREQQQEEEQQPSQRETCPAPDEIPVPQERQHAPSPKRKRVRYSSCWHSDVEPGSVYCSQMPVLQQPKRLRPRFARMCSFSSPLVAHCSLTRRKLQKPSRGPAPERCESPSQHHRGRGGTLKAAAGVDISDAASGYPDTHPRYTDPCGERQTAVHSLTCCVWEVFQAVHYDRKPEQVCPPPCSRHYLGTTQQSVHRPAAAEYRLAVRSVRSRVVIGAMVCCRAHGTAAICARWHPHG